MVRAGSSSSSTALGLATAACGKLTVEEWLAQGLTNDSAPVFISVADPAGLAKRLPFVDQAEIARALTRYPTPGPGRYWMLVVTEGPPQRKTDKQGLLS